MPHVAYVCFSGLRIREKETLALGMSLPGLRTRADAIAQLPALGLLTLAGLTPPEWSCSYHEADDDPHLVERVLAERPALVAVSALTASIEDAHRFGDQLRRYRVPLVMGGLHVTQCPQEALAHADAVVVGEGDPVWPAVLEDAKSGRLACLYRASHVFDLSQAPIPRFELLGAQPRQRYTLQTQRGCPLACDFCGASRLLGPFREKPLANISCELDAIRKLDGSASIEWADDNSFAGSRDWGETFSLLGGLDLRYFTETDWRVGERADILSGLASSGCVEVLIGFESIEYRYKGMGPKRASTTRMLEAVEAIQQAGVAVNACFIVGSDGETRATLDHLASFLVEAPFAQVQLTLQTPFPGTALYRRLRNQGRLLAHRGWPFYTLFDVTYQPDSLSVEEFEGGFRELTRSVFSASAVERRSRIRKQIWHSNPRMRRCESERYGAI